MRKIVFISFFTILLPFITFAQTADDPATLQVIALLREQIRLLQEIIRILTSRIVVSAPTTTETISVPFVPTPTVSAEEKPFVRLSANGSGGKISIKKGESAILSWELSNHNWGYCGKYFGWEGTLKPISGSETVSPLYDTRYDIYCYISGTKYSDSLTILVAQPDPNPVATSSPSLLPKNTFLISDPGFKNCSLEVSRPFVTLGKDSLEATWIIDSDPRSAYFYWRGKDNGVDIGRVYGGKTQRMRIFDYGNYPVKYERYVEMFFAQEHYIGDPYISGCTTNTVTFEIKK